MEISQILKEKRAEHQLTQEQLAEKVFVSKKTISNWETGKTIPDIESLIRLSNLFDLSLDNLLLEGSDIVTNIKKLEKARNTHILYGISFLMQYILLLALSTEKVFGKLSSFASSCILIALFLNLFILYFFGCLSNITHDTPQLKKRNRFFFIITIIISTIFIIFIFLSKLEFSR